MNGQFLAAALAAFRRHRDFATPCQIVSGQAAFCRFDISERPARNNGTTVHASARPHIDDMIGVADRVFIMFNDDNGIAKVAQPLEGFKQAVIVALVQADAWFIKHIKYAGKAAANLARQPDALAFAA